MLNVIFLNGVYLSILKEQRVNLNGLTWKTLKGFLSHSDYQKIVRDTKCLFNKNGIMSVIGMDVSECYCDGECLADVVETNDNGLRFPVSNLYITGTYSVENTLVMWLEECKLDYCMYKKSRLNILNLLSKIMIFKELVKCNLFKSAFLAEGK